ncbi:IS3 family transposase [Brevibacterium aurantiacum]|uniref:IS3 family transposase n=1 Tax=Brevibacterium aurantiacum TaxID=273384 RepID=A0A2A3Z0I2_BREAU|nr:IS3 family transposase [Brevibacterium aurantiacum]PCC45019.1 IS3 family transposase [Brevibacterium aurantiacum]
MSSSGPRAGGPSRRRSFTPAQKLELLTQYEDACTRKEGGALLRGQGLYSSQIAEWRKLRDAGALTGKKPGESIGKLSAEQVEIARLRRQLEVSEGRLERSEAALDVNGKTLGVLRERHRRVTGRAEVQEEMNHAYRELLDIKIATRQAAGLVGLSRTTIYRKPAPPVDQSPVVPPNKLSPDERAEVLSALNSPEFVDLAPQQVYTKLLDEGIYLGSVSTFYRILKDNEQIAERRRLATHPARTIPELVATAPGQVMSWDITKLAGPVKGKYFDCYVMIDIHSRFIVGAHVHATESGTLAVEMMKEIFGIHGIPDVVHADRGTSMTSKTVAGLLSDLEVTRSHSRPRVSNDNPYSEALFKSLKYGPTFPDRFASLPDARAFISGFVDWYNHDHQHSGIGFHTPANVHYGFADAVAVKRSQTLAIARAKHSNRFTTATDPKILALPGPAWINEPKKMAEAQAA